AVLDRALRLLHPFMPFVTEEVWQHLWAGTPKDQWPAEALIIAPWPVLSGAAEPKHAAKAEADFALVQEIVTRIRDARREAAVDPARRIQVILAAGENAAMLKQQAAVIEQLARTQPPRIERKIGGKPEQAMALVAGGVEIYLPLAGLLDVDREL